MNEIVGIFNNKPVILTYNKETGYYETELTAPETGGIYEIDVAFTDLLGDKYTKTEVIQIFAEEKIKLQMDKVFMWIFDYRDFTVKDIVEISDYEISIDEETNKSSTVKIFKNTEAVQEDIVAIKINNKIVYFGIIDKIDNNNGEDVYNYTLKYITNMFNQNVILKNEILISNSGIEDFIKDAIISNFADSTDSFINRNYLEIEITSHTKLQTTVSNVNNNIYNLHTWMKNCTKNNDIIYNFKMQNKKLVVIIGKKEIEEELIDVNAQAISNYNEVFETNVTAKVTVLTKEEGEYNLYLLNDRTTTTDKNNTDRACGKTEVIYMEKMENARQAALDKIKTNSYNHNVSFSMLNKFMEIGTPISIKTKKSVILDTYISAVSFSNTKLFNYTCGNIRTKFIDKLLKERNS